MGVEIPFEEIPALQKMIIKKTMESGKPAITATQMLESDDSQPAPGRVQKLPTWRTRFMTVRAQLCFPARRLSAGYPVEAVSTMSRIAKKTEEDINYIKRFSKTTI